MDAEPRGIEQGDTVRVKNEFGEIELLAKVTPRVVPGTVAVSQGAWHDADMAGDRVDKGGSINTLTTPASLAPVEGQPAAHEHLRSREGIAARKGEDRS